jgi:acetyl-CoA carboxylase biotin carboxyl carrier protein
MTDTDEALEAFARAADELVPALTERLRRHGLGEIEVVQGDLRLRVSASQPAEGAATHATETAAPTDASAPTAADGAARPPAIPAAPAPSPVGVASPAVGFFVYADGLGPGLEVGKGDALGHIEMLGVRHDVRAPRAGTVRNLVAESGEAVEYGQVVLELEPPVPAR